MAGRKAHLLPDIDLKKITPQQAEIYKMAGAGLTYTEIARKLGVKVGQVTSQVCRIKKKAWTIANAYKRQEGAEHVQKQVIDARKNVASPAEELKQLLKHDPGFIRLMRLKYGGEEKMETENLVKSAALTNGKFIRTSRARSIKMLSASGKNNKIVVKLTPEQRKRVELFLKEKNISPLEVFWDDKSSVYIIDIKEWPGLKKAFKESNREKPWRT